MKQNYKANLGCGSKWPKSLLSSRGLLGCLLTIVVMDVAAQKEEAKLEEVIVTAATRLASGFDSPKPTTTVDKGAMNNRGITNIADYLNEIPAFTGTNTPVTSTTTSRSVGGSSLDLRTLGPNRTLVLVDRRRYVPTSTGGTLNTNIIPQALVEQVEVVTGGASAQWGSDAVAGVVNMKLNRNLQGVKLDTRFGQTSKSDAKEEFVSFAVGGDILDGRGHVGVAMEYQDNNGVENQSDRDWGRDLWGIVNNPADTGPNDGIPAQIVVKNVRLGFGTPGGVLTPALGNHPAVSGIKFGPNGELLPYDFGDFPVPAAFATLPFQVGGDGGSLGAPSGLLAPVNRKSMMLAFDFEVNDDLSFFMDVSYGEMQSTSEVVQPWNFIGGGPDVIFPDNPFIPADLRQIMVDNGVAQPLIMGRTNEDHGFITSDVTTETLRIVAGLEGTIADDWNWDVYVSSGETDDVLHIHNQVVTENRNFAVDAVRDPSTGNIVCRANLGGANGAPGCEPLNLFGNGAPSQAALNYIHRTMNVKSTIEQDVFAANVSGELFELPAGPVAIAFGAEYREESASSVPDVVAENGGYFLSNSQSLSGKFHVKESYIEVGVPVLVTDGGMSLDLNGAMRYTDYSTSGGANTWSFGTTFKPYGDLTLRGSVSQDIRAPNINELFASQEQSFFNIANPNTGLTALAQVFSGGNVGLDVESAKTKTIGMVYQPSWLESLSLSADWYKIEVDDAISTLPAQTIVNNCFSSGLVCENVTVVGGVITSVNTSFINVAQRKVEGVDFEIDYSFDELWGGFLSLRLLGSYVEENSFSPDGEVVFDDAGVVGVDASGNNSVPEWRWNMSADYSRGNWGVTGQVRYVDGGNLINDTNPETINFKVDDVYYFNISGRYDVDMGNGKMLQLYGGVNNVFDRNPPVAPWDFVSNWGTNMQHYDVVGRYVFAGVRLSFDFD